MRLKCLNQTAVKMYSMSPLYVYMLYVMHEHPKSKSKQLQVMNQQHIYPP